MVFPVKIFRPENKAAITLNPKFYDLYSITEACERFAGLAKISVEYSRERGATQIIFMPKAGADAEGMALEFCNHVLHVQAKG